MESKEMLELRYKRLNYYNRLVFKEKLTKSDENDNKNRGEYFQIIDNLTLNKTKTNAISLPKTNPSLQFIQNFFEGSKPDIPETRYSKDEPTTNQYVSNKKLEEFKKVVETSYNLHVVKKNESTTQKETPQEESKLKNIFTSQLSTDSSLDSSRPENSFRSNESNTLSYKIPYMSAYNIYTKDNNLTNRRLSLSSTLEEHNLMENYSNNNDLILPNMRKMSVNSNEDQPQQIDQIVTNINKLSSNGSSLNVSPTSQSSSSSSFFVQQPPILQAKPPETPRANSAVSSYRKNLLKLSIDSSVKNDTVKSLDFKKEVNQSIKLSDSLEISSKPIVKKIENDKLDNFFNTTSTNNLKIKSHKFKTLKKKNNVFNFVNEYEDEEETKAEDFSNDEDNNDTFDIFSSQESLEKTIEENVKQMDLNIDLGLLSDQEEESKAEKKIVLNYHFDDDCSINEKLTSNVLSSARQKLQKKPDNIPNLMLDLMDDDKSTQSVAASLAKSMCKEIDYQKEMEIIYTIDNKEQDNQQQTTLKSQRDQLTIPKKLNKLNFKTSAPIHLNKVVGTNLKPQVSEPPIKLIPVKNDYLKPPQSARLQIQAKNSNLDCIRPESAAGNLTQSKSRIKLNKIDLTSQSTSNFSKKTVEVKKSKNFLSSASKESTVKIKPTLLKKKLIFIKNRPSHSAMSKYTDFSDSETNENNLITDEDIEPRSKSTLYFNYSKLVSIESNLQQELNETNRTDELEQVKTNEFLTRMTMGDQEAYKYIFDNKTKTEYQQQNQIDWLDIPDEIWLRIIRLLEHKDLVQFGSSCKKLRNLYLDNSLWRKITMKYKYNVQDEWLSWIGKRRPNELNIVQCNGNITLNSIVEMFRSIGPELNSLNLSRCSTVSLSGDNFALQASIRCPNITSLDLSWTLLSNQTLKLISDSFRKIESINLSGCSMVGEDGFNALITRHGETLKNLEISGCIHFSTNCIINIGAYCRGLEKLNISNCHRMTNESIMEACPQWLKLKFLDLRGIKSIKNNCVSTIVRRCNNIEGLALGECIHLSDASILEIATYKPNIKYLDINGCKKITDNSIRSIANFCVKLEYVNLRATNITDMGLITLANGKCIKTIEELNLSYLPISELILIKILRNGSKLKKLHLYGCYNIKKLDEIKKTAASENNKHVVINI